MFWVLFKDGIASQSPIKKGPKGKVPKFDAAGEALPPHFQFQMVVQSDETERIRHDLMEWMMFVSRKFGGNMVKLHPSTFGANAKGGMDD